MNGQFVRHGADHLREKREKRLVAMLRHALLHDRARRHVEGGELRRRAMALVVVCHRPRAPFLPGQPRLRAVQRLDLTLLIEREDHRALGRMQIQAHDIAQRRDELRIARQLEPRHAMRLETVRLSDPRNRRVMMARRLRHQPRAPMRAGRRRGLERAGDDRGFLGERNLLGTTRARPIRGESGPPLGVVAIQPARHGRPRDAELGADRIPSVPGRRRQDNPGPLDHAPGRRPRAHNLLQPSPVAPPQHNASNW